ncbi:MAG: hypothetical protein OXQ29_19875 [Rhodospirillaceae bacterium]|nr:hypothetical protein [Rhodospirillaceae bacterium]
MAEIKFFKSDCPVPFPVTAALMGGTAAADVPDVAIDIAPLREWTESAEEQFEPGGLEHLLSGCKNDQLAVSIPAANAIVENRLNAPAKCGEGRLPEARRPCRRLVHAARHCASPVALRWGE